jgi:hypothetical protein
VQIKITLLGNIRGFEILEKKNKLSDKVKKNNHVKGSAVGSLFSFVVINGNHLLFRKKYFSSNVPF